MKASPDAWARRRLTCLALSVAVFLGVSFVGCGSSENKVELTPEAKQAVNKTKVGDPSKFVKPKGKRR